MQTRRVAIRDHSAEANLFARRTLVSFIGVVILLLVLFSNLYQLQITSHDTYTTRSNENRIKLIPIAPNRGLIYDRNGRLLAENRPVYSLDIVPEQVENIEITLEQLQAIIPISEGEIKRFRRDLKRTRRFNHVTLKNRLDDELVAKFSVHQHKFPGVSVAARLKRFYPYGETLTHSLGYMGKINQQDVILLEEQEKTARYAATQNIGKLGIEKFYEDQLHGEVGYEEVEVNNRGRIIRTLTSQPPVPGTDIVLSIDLGMQQLAQQLLVGRRGAVVALNPKNGELLTLYSNPSYDPNWFVHGITSKQYRSLLNSPDNPLYNRTTQGTYPPASTIKPHLGLLSLEKGIVTDKTTIWDPGYFTLPKSDHKFRDHTPWGHGKVNLYDAIAKSCDTYFFHMAYRLGIDNISEFIAKFGFGEYTGVDIREEKAGILPSRGWKKAHHNQSWYTGDTISIGIGQGYWTTTPLQLAHATGIIARKGENYTPRLRRSPLLGETLSDVAEERPPVVLKNPANWDIIQKAMEITVAEGSARTPFKGASYISAGKTGTAQVKSIAQDEKYDESKTAERHRDNAMYVGYAPADNPEIVVVVALENAGGGGKNAAPVAREIMDYYFDGKMENSNAP